MRYQIKKIKKKWVGYVPTRIEQSDKLRKKSRLKIRTNNAMKRISDELKKRLLAFLSFDQFQP